MVKLRLLIFVASCLCLLALVVFITVATHANFLVVLPALLSAVYLAYAAAYWTMPDLVGRFYLRLKKWADEV